MALDARTTAIMRCCLLGVTCILYIVSNAVPKWSSITVNSQTVSTGLWSGCGPIEGTIICLDAYQLCSIAAKFDDAIIPTCVKIQAARAFMTIACIMSGLSALSFLANVLMNKDSIRPALVIISKILPLVSLVAGIIGMAVGIAFVMNVSSDPTFKLNVAAIIAIVGVVLNIIGAILALMIK